MSERYPGYNVLDKWNSPSFDDVTRDVLTHRLEEIPARCFLTEKEWALLEALAAHLLPQPERADPIPIVPWLDAMLAEGDAEGFRRTDEPPDAEVWRTGLAAIENESKRRHGKGFVAVDAAKREMLLHEMKTGVVSDGWTGVAPKRFLIDFVLKAMAGIYYSHPDAWSEIGFGGPASPRGYVRFQLDKHDPWEGDEAK